MSSIMTRPQGMVPIGHVVVGGVRLPVRLDLEWDRYLSTLDQRAGGVTGLGTADVDAGYFAVMQPAPQVNADAYMMVMQSADSADGMPDIILQGGVECCLPEMTFQR